MYLMEPDRTPYDLSWRMFGIPIRVHPVFWLLAAFLAWDFMRISFGAFFLVVGCVFVSILVHELGHVFMGRVFGRESHIVLYGFGGVAVSYGELPYRFQRILVSLAGPLAGFALYGLVWLFKWRYLSTREIGEVNLYVFLAFEELLFINLWWNLLNLVPVWPLDGGKISREVFTGFLGRKGVRVSLVVSVVLALLIAAQALSDYLEHPLIPSAPYIGGQFTALVFGLLALQSLQALQQETHPPWREDWPDQDEWSHRERERWRGR